MRIFWWKQKKERDEDQVCRLESRPGFCWNRILFSLFFAFILLFWCSSFTEKLVDYYGISREQNKLEGEQQTLIEKIEALEKEKRLLNQDWYIEKLARDKLNLAKPGEIVVKVIDKDTP
ncbi:MAG: septum formation initiator family protein [Candidatus Atribacteria bacterium]|nr:septum formation initiator family protein [Candidatus Atribacteria bacterium]